MTRQQCMQHPTSKDIFPCTGHCFLHIRDLHSGIKHDIQHHCSLYTATRFSTCKARTFFCMQCKALQSRIFEEMYSALPEKSAYEQQEVYLWAGLTAFLQSLAEEGARAFLERHSVILSLCFQRCGDISQPDVDIARACYALTCISVMFQKVGRFKLTFLFTDDSVLP